MPARLSRLLCRLLPLAALLLPAPLFAQETLTELPDNTERTTAQSLPDHAAIDIKLRKSDDHYFKLSVPRHAVCRLSLNFQESGKNPVAGRLFLSTWGTDKELYSYPLRVLDQKHRADSTRMLLFPVLDAGDYYIQLRLGAAGNDIPPDAGLRLSWESLDPKTLPLTDDEKARARVLLGNALHYLLNTPPEKDRDNYSRAIESLALAALSEGTDGAARRDLLDKTFLPLLDKSMQRIDNKVKNPDGSPVRAAAPRLYEAAIVTLATAELAGQGDPHAKALCEENARYLLLSQLGPRRPKEWMPREAPNPLLVGGWRYEHDSSDADLSVTGWCAVALIATDAAGIHLPQTRDALHDASAFITQCTSDGHFDYMPRRSSNPGNIRSAIGALLLLLDAQDSSLLDNALDNLDAHLPAYTQVDQEEDYPLYYAYYGTRVNYLRGGFAWHAWRRAMMEQLFLWQKPDGSFPSFGSEDSLHPRYATALAAMITRICLEDVPNYMKLEVKGF